MAGDSGGAAEAVDDGVTGLVVRRPDDPRDVAAAIEALLDDDRLRADMAVASRQRLFLQIMCVAGSFISPFDASGFPLWLRLYYGRTDQNPSEDLRILLGFSSVRKIRKIRGPAEATHAHTQHKHTSIRRRQ